MVVKKLKKTFQFFTPTHEFTLEKDGGNGVVALLHDSVVLEFREHRVFSAVIVHVHQFMSQFITFDEVYGLPAIRAVI